MALAILIQEDRHEAADAVDHTPGIDAEDPVVVRDRPLPGEPTRKDAGVVADDVDGTECVQCFLG